MKIFQFADRSVRALAQVEYLLGEFVEHSSARRKRAVLRGAIEERLAQFALEPADGLADCRSSAMQRLGCSGKALLVGDRHEHFELIYVQGGIGSPYVR